MSTCNRMYIPYSISELQTKIQETLDKITEYTGMSEYEKVKNGNDEYVSGDVLTNLQKEHSMWQGMLKEKQRQLGNCSIPSNFTSKLYGC